MRSAYKCKIRINKLIDDASEDEHIISIPINYCSKEKLVELAIKAKEKDLVITI